MKVDNSEIKEAVWSKLSAFRFIKDKTRNEGFYIVSEYYDEEGENHLIEVPMHYALMIGESVRHFRDKEIQALSQLDGSSLYSSRENLEAKIKQILNNSRLNPIGKRLEHILGATPESELSDIAINNIIGKTSKEKEENLIALSQLGKNAHQYHKKIKILAQILTSMPIDKIPTADHLEYVAHEGPVIESCRLSKTLRPRLFTTLLSANVRDSP